MRKALLFASLLMASFTGFAQDDLLAELESTTKAPKFQQPAFKTMRIANLQSTKVAAKGDLYMIISHRFGSVKDGFDTFFGLDQANTKIEFLYGASNRLQLGISRESYKKTYGGLAKFALVKQQEKIPFNVTLFSEVNINSEVKKKVYKDLIFNHRLSYLSQVLISSRITNKLSLELAPSFLHQNLVYENTQDHEQYGLGFGGRYQLTKRFSLNVDYVMNFNRNETTVFKNPLTIGVDIETGGHIFQLLFSNAESTNGPAMMANAAGDWSKGEIYFGFNLVRVF
jgi:hypothetical protein